MKRALAALLAAPLLLAACSSDTSPENWESADDISAAIQEINENCANPENDPELDQGECGNVDTGFYYYAMFGDGHELDEEFIEDGGTLWATESTRIKGENWIIWCWKEPGDNCAPLHDAFGGELTTFPES